MNRHLCLCTAFTLSLACSSDPATESAVSPGASTGDTSSASNTGSSVGQTTTSAAPTTISQTSTTTTSTAQTTSQPNSTSTSPQTTATSSQTSTVQGTGSEDVSPTGGSGSSSSADESSSSASESDESSDSETTSGGGGGECVKGSTSGSEVLMIGEPFIAATHEITRTIENLARQNGSLAQGESYGDRSVSGTRLTGGGEPTITNQYLQYSGRDDVRYVLMDGGGNDCLQGAAQQPASALGAAEALLAEMGTSGVEKVVYFFYPDPLPPIGNDSLKSCLDTLRPQMKELCDGLTSPECHWLDLREIWDGHPEYTDDGIHPTSAGSTATGEAIWDVMVENCVAQ